MGFIVGDEEMAEMFAILRAVSGERLHREDFSNMGIPDSVLVCSYCGGDDYNRGGTVEHRPDCVQRRAAALLKRME